MPATHPETAPTARVDRMVLTIPGGSAADGRRVALLVAASLAETGALPQAGDLPRLRVSISGDDNTDPATLARRIVQATLRELARAP
jgi:hypothetical protein